MISCVQGLVEGDRGLDMQRFGHILIFLDRRCAWWLGGCGLGGYWFLEAMGPC